MRYSEKLARLCEARGWSQSDLWRAIGKAASKATVSNWFNGVSRPQDLDAALRIARALGVSLDYLADDAMDEPDAGLSDDEVLILRLAGQMDVQEAIRRLLDLGEVEVNASPSHRTIDARGREIAPAPAPGSRASTRPPSSGRRA